MMQLALIFGSTFLAVFTLGLQSLNVNQGERLLASVTSIAISAGHIGLYKFMPDAGVPQMCAYFAGGVAGINASMSAHPRIKAWITRWRAKRRPDEHADVGRCGAHHDTH